MADTPVSSIDALLKSATEEANDPEVRYKLRTARQLIDVIEQDSDELAELATNANATED